MDLFCLFHVCEHSDYMYICFTLERESINWDLFKKATLRTLPRATFFDFSC